MVPTLHMCVLEHFRAWGMQLRAGYARLHRLWGHAPRFSMRPPRRPARLVNHVGAQGLRDIARAFILHPKSHGHGVKQGRGAGS